MHYFMQFSLKLHLLKENVLSEMHGEQCVVGKFFSKITF